MPDVFVDKQPRPEDDGPLAQLRDARMSEDNPTVPLPPIAKPLQNRPPQKKTSFFSGFAEYPTHVRFQTQDDDETIVLFLRKSQIINIPWIFFAVLFMLFPPIIIAFHTLVPLPLPILSLPIGFLWIGIGFYYLAIITYAFVNFLTWYYNVAFITNKRVVDVDFHQLVFKDVAETKLELVQDVSYRQVGVIENLFNYGHVLIQTAGTVDNFEFNALPYPERVVEIVETLIGKKKDYGV